MKKLFYLIIGGMFFYFIQYPSRAFAASQNGILLWFDHLLPTLLPFSILSNIVMAAGGESAASNRTFLRIGSWEWFAILCGTFFGFPIGSKLAADLYAGGRTTKERAQILAASTNNMSPAFVSTYVCCSVLERPELIFPMYALLYGPPLVIGCIRLAKTPGCPCAPSHKNTASRFHIDMQIIDAGIMNSFLTLMKLCGYIVMFSITADIFLHIRFLPDLARNVIVGLTEVTNGIAQLSHTAYSGSRKFLLSILFLSLGGMSGIAQTNAMLSPCGLSIRTYLSTKLFYVFCSVAIGLCIIAFAA